MEQRDIDQRILKLISKGGRVQTPALTTGFGEIPGWDSLRHAEFIIDLQKEFGVRLSTPQILAIDSPAAAAAAIGAASAGK